MPLYEDPEDFLPFRPFKINSLEIFERSKDWVLEHNMESVWQTLSGSYRAVIIDGRGPFPLKRDRPFHLMHSEAEDDFGEAIAFHYGEEE